MSYDSIRAIIIDYGNAIYEAISTDHYIGTIAYLAPEVMKLKHNKGIGEPYDCFVDVWGLGLSGYQLFFRACCK